MFEREIFLAAASAKLRIRYRPWLAEKQL